MAQEQKYALVSGASSGIGYALAEALAKKGYKVFGCAPEPFVHQMNPLKQQYGLHSFACDITKVADLEKAAQLIEKETGGKLHVLYNNAGIATIGPAAEVPEDMLRSVFEVNVFGQILMTKFMAQYVINAKGTILFTASIAGISPLSWVSVYSASKAAINSYAATLHVEMKPFGVRVHSVITGGVDTAIGDKGIGLKLPTKLYDVEGFDESINSSALMSRNVNESPERYANGIVKKIEAFWDPGFNLYKGRASATVTFVTRHLPLWLVELGVAVHFKQWRVLRRVRRAINQSRRRLKQT